MTQHNTMHSFPSSSSTPSNSSIFSSMFPFSSSSSPSLLLLLLLVAVTSAVNVVAISSVAVTVPSSTSSSSSSSSLSRVQDTTTLHSSPTTTTAATSNTNNDGNSNINEYNSNSDDDNNNDDEFNFVVPNAQVFPVWQIILLSILYYTVALVAFLGLIVAIRASPRAHFRAAFLAVTFAFCALRGVLASVNFAHWQDHMFWVYLMCEFVPIYLEYFTFTLLILFVVKCVKVIHGEQSQMINIIYPSYFLVQALLLALCITMSAVLANRYTDADEDTWDQIPALAVAFFYTILVVAGVYWTRESRQLLNVATSSISTQSKVRRFLVLIPVYIAVFALRALWNFLYYANVNPLQQAMSTWINERSTSYYLLAALCFYGFFEIFPSALTVFIVAIRFRPRKRPFAIDTVGIAGSIDAGRETPRPDENTPLAHAFHERWNNDIEPVSG